MEHQHPFYRAGCWQVVELDLSLHSVYFLVVNVGISVHGLGLPCKLPTGY